MGKRRFFLGFLAILVVSLIGGAVYAAGYVCDKTYTKCKSPYYLSSGSCYSCTSLQNTASLGASSISHGARVTKCNGYYTSSSNGTSGGTGGSNSCSGCSSTTTVTECQSGYTPSGTTCVCSYGCSGVTSTETWNETQSCGSHGTGSRTVSLQCIGNYTSSGCYSGGETCSGCSKSEQKYATPCVMTSCDSGYYLENGSCYPCTDVSFTKTPTQSCSVDCQLTQTITVSVHDGNGYKSCTQKQTRKGSKSGTQSGTQSCKRTGGAGGTNGSSQCTGENCDSVKWNACTNLGNCISNATWLNDGDPDCPSTYTSCDDGYYLENGTCKPCTAVSFNESTNIANGTRNRTCYYTGGAGGTKGVNACTGATCNTWTCSCNSGWHASGSGASCSCTQDCTSDCTYNATQTDSCGILTNGTYIGTKTCNVIKDGVAGCYTWSSPTGCTKTCNANYYLSSDKNSCIACSTVSFTETGTITNGTRSRTCYRTTSNAGSTSADQCTGSDKCGGWTYKCNTGYELNTTDNTCNACPTGYCCTNNTKSNCTNAPANAHYTGTGATNCSACDWICDNRYYLDNNKCEICPIGSCCTNGTKSNCSNAPAHAHYTGTGETNCSACDWICDNGYYLDNNKCEICPIGHTCTGGGKTPCTNKPENSHYTTNGTCDWDCDSDYNKSGNTCVKATYQCEAGKAVGSDGKNSATCAPGFYCPGEVVVDKKDCQKPCPTDSVGGTVTSNPGSSLATECKTTRTGVELADKTGSGNQTCNYKNASEGYVNNCNTNITCCHAGRWREQENSTTCASTMVGKYSPECDLRSLACSDLTGADATVKTSGTNAGAATECYNTCPDKSITNGKLVPTVREPHYNATSKNIPACQYTTPPDCDDHYHVDGQTCQPDIYAITLNHNGGTSSTSTIYLKYGVGWYSNSAATQSITSVALPTLAGKTCSGYKSGNTFIVLSTGALVTNYKVFTANATITADYSQNESITCVAGQYYTGTGKTCTQCPAGSYCGGTSAIRDSNEVSGLSPCPTDANTYTSATGADGNKLTTKISSAPGAKSESECYATNLAYTTNNGSGSQTCYYKNKIYNDSCTAKTILMCKEGHWHATSNAIDCEEVGYGYYSGKKELTRHACPNKDQYSSGENIVTTSQPTSESVQQCFLGNIWYEPDANTGARRTCFHTADASDTNPETGYSYNCALHVIRTCAAGYYDDGKLESPTAGRICAPVTNKDSYSPSQMVCKVTDREENKPQEKDQPSASDQAGCSTKLKSCPETTPILDKQTNERLGTAKRVFQTPWNAEDFASCIYGAGECDEDYTFAIVNGDPICYFSGVCPPGNYCPEDCDPKVENCIKPCPTDKNGRKATSDAGSTEITQCYIVYNPYQPWEHGTGHATCYYSLNTTNYTACGNAYADTCEAGYYYKDEGSFACVGTTNGNYSVANDISQTECPAGGNGSTEHAALWNACYKNCSLTVANSTSVAATSERVYGVSADVYAPCSFNVTCKTGYAVQDNNTARPSCNAKTYTITLNKNGGVGNVVNSVQCTFDSGACTLPAAELSRTGYNVQARWCTENNGAGTCYTAGQSVTTNISSTGDNITLYAVWTPQVYKVTLAQAAGETAGAPKEVYLKYATGWYTDNTATIPLRNIVTMPTKTGYEFGGYTSTNKVQVISADGNFVTSEAALTFTIANTSVNAVWTADKTTCPEGTYYSGTGSTCLPCPEDHYCPGGTFGTDSGTIGGRYECPDGGLAPEGSTSASACYKTNLPTYVAMHGKGTQTCYYSEDARTYSIKCKDKYITTCDAGYWQENKAPNQTAPDCAAVSRGFYSGTEDVNRYACPNNGTTESTTTDVIQKCYKTGLDYKATYGTGTQRCFYSSGEGNTAVYARDCDTKEINKCRGGYWRETDKATDCIPVGLNYYSETDEIIRHACPAGGVTNSTITSTPTTCYRDGLQYTAEHGGGKQSCYYTSGEGDDAIYETSCERIQLEYCNAGYWTATSGAADCIEAGYGYYSPAPDLDRYRCAEGETTKTKTSSSAAQCFICPPGKICPPGEIEDCPEDYPMTDGGATDKTQCYRPCDKQTMGEHILETTGHDYYGGNNTCVPSKCEAGYHVHNNQCVECPEDSFCPAPGPDDPDCEPGETCGAKKCSELGDGSWKYSAKGAKSAKDCYRKCEAYELEGGTAIPKRDIEYWDKICEYDGIDPEGNPCEIIGSKCVVTLCKSSYEMINGKCVPCNRENALTYKSGGNCIVETCRANFHPYGDKCVADVTECSAPNAVRAEMRWNSKTNTFGICTILECESGFHISSNACVTDIQECTVEHGRGEREWNHNSNTWGDCIATYCEPGFTNDPSESNEPTKQCGNCKNKFGVDGELAASTYSRGCTISACMYQGEMYNLENNECNPICSVNGYEDETGTMKWDSKNHKCVRNCKDGYSMW